MKFSGLTDREVEHSRQQYGSNAIPDSQPTTFWEAFKETFGDPMIRILLIIAGLMIVMWVLGYADIYEPAGTIVAVLIVAFVSAKTSVASDTKYRELKGSTKKVSVRSTEMVSLQYLMSKTWLWVTRFFCSPGIRFLQTGCCCPAVCV